MSVLESLKKLSIVEAARKSVSYVSGSDVEVSESHDGSNRLVDDLPPEIQQEIAREQARDDALRRLRSGVEVKDRKYHLKKYKQCFVGREAVDFMVTSGWAKSRADAVRIGLELQIEHKLFEHVVDGEKHPFKDEYLFFRFAEDRADGGSTMDNSSSSFSNHDSHSSVSNMSDSLPSRASSISTIYEPITTSCGTQLGAIAMGEILREGVACSQNYTYDASGFFAEAAVDFLVSTGLASSREDAVRIGAVLESPELGVIRSCASNVQGGFRDARIFYSFTDDSKNTVWRDDLRQAKDFLRSKVRGKTLTYHLKSYKNCFLGRDVVSALSKGVSGSREDALLVGRAMMYEYNLFRHVVDEHTLEDDGLFYKYNVKTVRSSSVPSEAESNEED